MSYRPENPDRGLRARPYGSNSTAISIAITVLVIGLVGIAAVLWIRNDSDNDPAVAGASTEDAATETLPLISDSTAPPSASGELVPVTPSPATEPTPSATPPPEPTEEPSPTPSVVSEIVPTPSATEEPDPTEEPVEPAPTDTVDSGGSGEEPAIGDYGQLPPAQLPSGGVASTLSLDYQLGLSLESLPASGTVYWIEWPVYTFDQVRAAADSLGLVGEVVEEGVGIYRVDSDRGMLFVSPGEIVYRSAGFAEGSDVPDDATAIAAASDWLAASGLLGGNADGGAVVGRDDNIGTVVVKFRPVEPKPNLAPQPGATVTVGGGSTILEVRIRWPNALVPSEYGFIAPIDIWGSVQSGLGYLEADLSSVFATGALSGTATMTDYSIAYTMAGSPAGDEYLVPIITFHGTALLDQSGDEIPVSVSVPAVYHQAGSLG